MLRKQVIYLSNYGREKGQLLMEDRQRSDQPEQTVSKDVQCQHCHAQYKVRGDQRMQQATRITWPCPNCHQINVVLAR